MGTHHTDRPQFLGRAPRHGESEAEEWESSERDSPTMSVTLRPNLNFATKTDNTSVDWDELKGKLSSFQVDKLNYFFTQFFDRNQDGVIDAKDFSGLNERLRKVAGWDLDDPQYLAVCDNNRVFFECLLEQAYAERNTEGLEDRTWEQALAPSKMVVDSVSLNSWLHMWARMCKGAAGIDGFPIWVQLIPRVIFNVICSKMRVDYITRSSLRNFYENFSGLGGDTLEKVTTEGYRSMSANGDYELDYQSYKLLFSNFLLGRTIYGPGKYIFGCFDNRDMNEPYKIVYDM